MIIKKCIIVSSTSNKWNLITTLSDFQIRWQCLNGVLLIALFPCSTHLTHFASQSLKGCWNCSVLSSECTYLIRFAKWKQASSVSCVSKLYHFLADLYFQLGCLKPNESIRRFSIFMTRAPMPHISPHIWTTVEDIKIRKRGIRFVNCRTEYNNNNFMCCSGVLTNSRNCTGAIICFLCCIGPPPFCRNKPAKAVRGGKRRGSICGAKTINLLNVTFIVFPLSFLAIHRSAERPKVQSAQ